MHEASIAQTILNELEERVLLGQLPNSILKVNLRVGRFTAIVPDNLKFMYDVLKVETQFSETTLHIEEIPIRCRCNICSNEFILSEIDFVCKHCLSFPLELLSGRELFIDSVEAFDD